ncbi:MAG: TIGR03617 family F420-dependent LLM class oxidoreductase [Roseiflexus sp.]|nr:TIGR03617 family F420-dependent LLM class oxidoreductase [Roseiflexus sp.]MCS7290423.1 TIGR03617 family F420-dependent LLM class oxidoreductase [Roseiflexus sp.]MDW8147670.1 TIGR03617 family F420-dependent LLM class oxidoreductase [Roseiflexaceae bacterium]MDW8231487.1 TIGR03617 family F420-dependent LLM class oxidoreductase [Roseiflexaceae bacterium]
MKLDATLMVDARRLNEAGKIARAAEAVGFAALWTPETRHNPFLPLVLAADHTAEIQLGTAVAIAFARSPMVTAQIAWDLQAFSGGRFILGLGTQVKAHIERRFGMTWDPPVPKLREYIQALRAIWQAFQTGGKLDYRGQFYNHTLMSPFFNPGPIADPYIPIYIAGVNEGLARLAGELCDGFHVHPFHSVKYINEIVRPQVAAGAAKAGRDPSQVSLTSSVFLITGPDEASMESARAFAREQIAFYASTPTYRVVLACHGWEDVGERLSRLAAARRWSEMGALITDEMLDVFAVTAPLDRIGKALRERYNGVLDRVGSYLPYTPGPLDDVWRQAVRDVSGGE